MAMGDNSRGGGDGVNGANSGGNTGRGGNGGEGSGGDGGNNFFTPPPYVNPYVNVADNRLPDFGKFNTFLASQFNPNFDALRNSTSQAETQTALDAYNKAVTNRSTLGHELQRRDSEINNFNTQVGQFNGSLNNNVTPLNQTLDFLRTADLNQFDQNFGNFELPNRSDLSSPDFNLTAPNFDNSFTVDGQAIDLSGAGFDTIATPLSQQDILANFDEAVGLRNTFQDQLDTRNASNRAFSSGFTNDLDAISRILDRGNFYGDGQLDSIFSDIGNLDAQLGGRSVQLDSFRPTFDQLGGDLGALRDQFDTAQDLYDTEDTRVGNFISGADKDLFALQNEFKDLGIEDYAQFDPFNTRIDDLTTRLGNFDSKINTPDISQLLDRTRALDTNLSGLRGDYEGELSRIENARRGFRGDIRNLTSDISNAGIYNGVNLDNIGNFADNIFENANYFDSPLDTDFSGILGDLSTQEGILQGLRDERSDALSGISSDIASSLQTGNDAELYNEDAIQSALDAILGDQSQLRQFTGGGLDTIANAGNQAVDALDQRLSDLNTQRDQIETDAGSLFSDLSADQFFNLDDVASGQSQLDDLIAQRDQYDATQANNEVIDIQDLLDQNTARIENDQSLLQERNNTEQVAQFNSLFNIDRDYVANQFANGDLSPEEYSILLGKVRKRDPEFANSIATQYQNLFG